MGKCTNHPDRETSYICMKQNVYLCEECLVCRDPDIYCKYRASCAINFIATKGFSDSEDVREKKEECVVTGDKEVTVAAGTILLTASHKEDT